MPLPTSLVVKNGSKILAITSGGMPQPVSSTSISTYSPAATPDPDSFRLSRSLMLRVRMASVPPSGMASRALTARLMITCTNCVLSALTYQRSRPDRILRSIFSPSARLSSAARSVSVSPSSSTSACSVCRREKASSWCTRPAARCALCLMFMMSR